MTEILSKDNQPLLGRTTIKAKMSFEGPTPNREHVRKEVAKAAGFSQDKVIIKTIKTGYGKQEAIIEAAAYDKLEDAKAVEHKSLMAKHEKKEEPKQEEAAAQEAPAAEEQPAEEEKEA